MIRDMMICKTPDNAYWCNVCDTLWKYLTVSHRGHIFMKIDSADETVTRFSLNVNSDNGVIKVGELDVSKPERVVTQVRVEPEYFDMHEAEKTNAITRYVGYLVAASLDWF